MPLDPVVTRAVVCGFALLASGLTYFSGLGLGTLLLPAFAPFFPVDRAIALTAAVHSLNGLSVSNCCQTERQREPGR